LGKKSWNVYNQDNIDNVRRDEAAAKAKEEAEEERMQEIDADRRLQILRGEVPTPIPNEPSAGDNEQGHRSERLESGRPRKRRKLAGENDTDFELRIASENANSALNDSQQVVLRKSTIEAPLTDHAGHIDLFPQDRGHGVKNAEAEKEAAAKRKEYEDQYTMRFSNAAGFKQNLDNPWYSKSSKAHDEADKAQSKDVWGNEDPRRKEREAARIVSNDPLAAMRQGASKVRQVEKERKKWQEERDREVAEMIETERRREKRRRRHRETSEDNLEGFTLDAKQPDEERRHRKKRRRSQEGERRSHRHRSRSRERGREKHQDERRDRHRHER
jgi:hypothetical protein